MTDEDITEQLGDIDASIARCSEKLDRIVTALEKIADVLTGEFGPLRVKTE